MCINKRPVPGGYPTLLQRYLKSVITNVSGDWCSTSHVITDVEK